MISRVIVRDPEILGGIPVFCGTRVPVRNLFECLEGGYTVSEFLDDFPSVSKEQVLEFLEETKASVEALAPACA